MYHNRTKLIVLKRKDLNDNIQSKNLLLKLQNIYTYNHSDLEDKSWLEKPNDTIYDDDILKVIFTTRFLLFSSTLQEKKKAKPQ